jgi:hypothetical protein
VEDGDVRQVAERHVPRRPSLPFAHGHHELQDPPEEEDEMFDVLDDGSGGAASTPISPAFFPSMPPMNGYPMSMPYEDLSSPSYAVSGSTSMRSTQPDSSLVAMVQMVQMISNLESEKVQSPSSFRTAPPPPPSKWQQADDNTQNVPVPAIPEHKVDGAQTAQVLKSTPQRNRPNRPLSPLSPTALNCLPSGLFSPGSLSVPNQLLGEASW